MRRLEVSRADYISLELALREEWPDANILYQSADCGDSFWIVFVLGEGRNRVRWSRCLYGNHWVIDDQTGESYFIGYRLRKKHQEQCWEDVMSGVVNGAKSSIKHLIRSAEAA